MANKIQHLLAQQISYYAAQLVKQIFLLTQQIFAYF